MKINYSSTRSFSIIIYLLLIPFLFIAFCLTSLLFIPIMVIVLLLLFTFKGKLSISFKPRIGETLEELKDTLKKHTDNYLKCLDEHQVLLSKIYVEKMLAKRRPSFYNNDILNNLVKQSEYKYLDIVDCLRDIRRVEKLIKEIDFRFKSSLPIQKGMEDFDYN